MSNSASNINITDIYPLYRHCGIISRVGGDNFEIDRDDRASTHIVKYEKDL